MNPLAHHVVARAPVGQLLFADATEAAQLWRTVVRAAPHPHALVLMPNHIHVVHAHDVRARLGRALGGYVRWLHRRHGRTGTGVVRLPAAQPVVDAQKLRRAERYVHLNPCRAGLDNDPLAWPWSTHRDRVGLALEPVVERAAQPRRYHSYTSSDPSVATEGTELPDTDGVPPTPAQLREVMASMGRVPTSALDQRGPLRTRFLSVGYALCAAPRTEVRAVVKAGRGVVVPAVDPRLVHRIGQAVRDPRMQDPDMWRWGRRFGGANQWE